MLRKFFVPFALLLTADVTTSAAAPVLGISTGDAVAADFTPRVKRIRIKRRRTGSGFKVTVKMNDGGDASSASVASVGLELCTEKACTDIAVGQDSYTGVFRSGLFSYDGAVAPSGEYSLQSELLNSDGKALGVSQIWTLAAKDGEIELTPKDEIDGGPYIAELTLTSDECGNGRATGHVTGDGAEEVGSVRWVSLDGLLFASDEVDTCGEYDCVDGSLRRGKTSFVDSEADLGEVGKALAETEEATVKLIVSAYDEKGSVIGSTTVEATAKYGDILIDGVPLEFD